MPTTDLVEMADNALRRCHLEGAEDQLTAFCTRKLEMWEAGEMAKFVKSILSPARSLTMEGLTIELDDVKYDRAVHGGLDDLPVLPESGDLAMYVKKNATKAGNAMVVITFTVTLPDGTKARAQAVTTATLLDMAGSCVRGWKAGGHI